MIRNNVTFRCPEAFVPFSDEEGILSIKGANWFATILRRISSLEVNSDFCQEDWGVVFFVTRNGKKFWIGLCSWPEGDSAWLAHVHHGSFAWLQRLSPSGKREIDQLIADIHDQLSRTQMITDITWYPENDMGNAYPHGNPNPK